MSADTLLQAATDGAIEGGTVIAVGGITHAIGRATSSITNAAKSAPKAEPVKPLPDEALEKIAGGAKDPEWRPQSILKPIMKTIHGEERNIAVHAGKQGKHIVGHNNYENALKQGKTPSILYGTEEDAQRLVNEFAGKGELLPQNPNVERIDFGKVIGKYVDENSGQMFETTRGTIRYAKEGVHVVPSNPNFY